MAAGFAHDAFFRPPDDADDTCLIYQAIPHTLAQQRWLKEDRLPAHANLSNGSTVINGLPRWRKLPAYCIYFADRMPLNYDVAVMANIMSWVLQSGLLLNEHDEATLSIIGETVLQGYYVDTPYTISPYYGRPVQIAYVLARLLGTRQYPTFSTLGHKLLQGIAVLADSNATTATEQMMLSTAAHATRWISPPSPYAASA